MNRFDQLMVIAMEECSEVAQRISKAARFGMRQVQPGQPLNNRERILAEYGDLVAALEMVGIYYEQLSRPAIDAKKVNVMNFLRYSDKICGTVSHDGPVV